MRRGSRPTLYELMNPESDRVRDERVVSMDQGPRALRVPKGFLYIGAFAVVLLMFGAYWLGAVRGAANVRAEWNQNRADTVAVERQMRDVLEVDEPGGATRLLNESVTAQPEAAAPPAQFARTESQAATAPADARESGVNYYVIDHPSEEKVAELVAFCRNQGLRAFQTQSPNGSPKVYVLPGYKAGESRSAEMEALRAKISTVGILWERLDPRRNSDFSTRYAEKYRPDASGS